MTIANWIAILVPILGLVGGAIVYMVQKAVDRKNQILAERREVYRRYVVQFEEAIFLLRDGSPETEFRPKFIELRKTSTELLITAPDTVIEVLETVSMALATVAVARYSDWDPGDELVEDFAMLEDKLESVIVAMRGDVFRGTAITKRIVDELISGFADSTLGILR